METPSSTKKAHRRLTLTQQNTANNTFTVSRRIEDSGKSASKSIRKSAKEQKGRSALVNITNDSPIIGLAMGAWGTPSCAIAKQRSSRVKNGETPGSGEALLRSQVRSLLKKAEEETRVGGRPFLLRAHGFADSSSSVLLAAPTPTNTPIIPDLTTVHGLPAHDGNSRSFPSTPLPVVEEELDGLQDDSGSMFEAQKSLSRSLLLDFSERCEFSTESNKPTPVPDDDDDVDDDSVSVWSTQVHASSSHLDELAELHSEDDQGDHDDGGLGGLCDAMVNINLNGNEVINKLSGKHIRYVYNSDDEISEVALCDCKEHNEEDGSPSDALRLKGLPSPKGKHMRFASAQGDD